MPGARSAVLGRFALALRDEPLPGIARRAVAGGVLTVELTAGRTLTLPDPTPFQAFPGYGDPAALARSISPEYAAYAEELDNSVANLALARATQPAPDPTLALDRLTGAPAILEQCVVDGHPLHPLCRTRAGMSTLDVLRYAPEHRPAVDLRLVAVPPGAFHHSGQWPVTLRHDGAALLPVHPWQAEHVLPAYPHLVLTGTLTGAPLMSLRTVAAGGLHLKTALSVSMTSAVRIVSPFAVHNGPLLSALVAELAPEVGVLRERAAGSVLQDSEPVAALGVVVREPPRMPAGHVALPAAALAAPSPATGAPLAHDLVALRGSPHDVLSDLVTVLLPPLLALLDQGVALEAHGQNTLLVVERGRIVGLRYRDFGGVLVNPKRLGDPPLTGAVVSDDPDALRTKLVAGAVSTVVSQTVATLADACGEPPDTLWATVAGTLRGVRHTLAPGAQRLLDSLFTGPWPRKATTAMRLARDHLADQWIDQPSPLA